MNELPVIQKTYDLIKWTIPILNKLPRDQKFLLGDRIIKSLLDLLDNLIIARYRKDKILLLENINSTIDILRYQIRLLHDLENFSTPRYEYFTQALHEIGSEVGGWLKQQKIKTNHYGANSLNTYSSGKGSGR
ncbi:MAG: diversity-generating retroelement protein Avd [Coleofasciculaceae cyanobacterium SM2_1_6]|nr:diversity-generating retroelement protein Avd [Coleofasciculaceae cyanobacterium SM2_1_6]